MTIEQGHELGAWGSGIFENDSAVAWLQDAVDSDSLAENTRRTLEAAVAYDDYLSVDRGSEILAAASIIAGNVPWTKFGISEKTRLRLGLLVKEDGALREISARAIDRVMSAADSELPDLWDDDEGFVREIKNLRRALGQL